MSTYIDFSLSYNTFNELIECLDIKWHQMEHKKSKNLVDLDT